MGNILLVPNGAIAKVTNRVGSFQQVIQIENGRANDVSDGFHTYDELYDHRMALTAALTAAVPEISWRSREHHPDGEPMFEGFFIVGITLPTGVITYHYKFEHWEKFNHVPVIDHAPAWDGHLPKDCIERLLNYAKLAKSKKGNK